MNIKFEGVDKLAEELQRLNSIRFDGVCKKQVAEMLNRARADGTPVDTRELQNSSTSNGRDEVGYTKEYAPHVEYGHRTRNGGFVPGQYYLKKNVDKQRGIFKDDLTNALHRGRK